MEEANTQLAATVKKDQEEVAATKKKLEELKAKSKPPTRGQLLAKALKACQKQPKRLRSRCMASAHRKYGPKAEKGSRRKALSSGAGGISALSSEPSAGRPGSPVL